MMSLNFSIFFDLKNNSLRSLLRCHNLKANQIHNNVLCRTEFSGLHSIIRVKIHAKPNREYSNNCLKVTFDWFQPNMLTD